MSISTTNQALLQEATSALFSRQFYAPFPEHPSPKTYGETADADGQAAYAAQLGKPFCGLNAGIGASWVGHELSPYIQSPLGITYPALSVDTYIEQAKAASQIWANLSADDRADILIESLMAVRDRFFEIAYATMHTTGQGYMMAFQASGPHAADRALEAIAMAHHELTRFTTETIWDKPMGKTNITLRKWWKAVPKGINVVVGCATFPTWNTVPGMYAGLMTGNPVIIKPHPSAILPIAIVVAELQKVLASRGLDVNICQLAPDTLQDPITKELVQHPAVKLIDYTGGTQFGNWIEALPGKITFTEKAGINSVVLESVDDIDAVVQNLAFSVCLYSGQMCTAPQNFFVPASGIKTPTGQVTPAEFAQKLSAGITALVDNPKAGPFVLGAIQNPATLMRVSQVDQLPDVEVILASRVVSNPQFAEARTASPTVLLTDIDNEKVYGAELFGPIAFVISCPDAETALSKTASLIEGHGAISCGVYSTDVQIRNQAAELIASVGAPVSFNLTGGIYLNQHASFSDFHVTGGNPAGNASFTNPSFVLQRFTLVGLREPVQ